MKLAMAGILALGLLLVSAPIALNITGHPMGALPSSIMLVIGILLVLFCAAMFIVTQLYARTKANEAFVRTGMGGLKVVRDGGALVLPILHQITKVSLATKRLEVDRKGPDALITHDKLRADIKAEFFIRVQPDVEAIQKAARSLGDRGENKDKDNYEQQSSQTSKKDGVTLLIEDKLVSALRTASARKTLEQLNSDREEFLREVVSHVSNDISHNGFTLESVTISKLDQTDTTNLKENNIFDAQGLRTIATITEKNRTERNEILRRNEREREAQDVETRKQILDLQKTRAEAEANQATQIATIQAEQTRITNEKQLESERAVKTSQVEQDRLVQVAQQAQQRDIAVADQERLKAITLAQQGVEVAKRNQEKTIAQAEAERALAQAKLAEAEAERTKAEQLVVTAKEIAVAEREKNKNVIAATAAAEQSYVKEAKAADGAAYAVKAQADARKMSADAEAEAILKKAGADASAAKLRAEGDQAAALAKAAGDQATLEAQAAGRKAVALAEAEGQRAVAMVPVEVAAKQVEIDQSRIENVLVPELEAREKSGKASQEYELSRLRIETEGRVRIESAKVHATILNKVTANVYGTPEDVAKMSSAFTNGMGFSSLVGGFLDGANNSPDLISALSKVGDLATAATNRLSPPSSSNGTTPPAE